MDPMTRRLVAATLTGAFALTLAACSSEPETGPLAYTPPEGAPAAVDPGFLEGIELLVEFEDVITPVNRLGSADGTMWAILRGEPGQDGYEATVYETNDLTAEVWQGVCGWNAAWMGDRLLCGNGQAVDPRTGETEQFFEATDTRFWTHGPVIATSEYVVMEDDGEWVGFDAELTELWSAPEGGAEPEAREGSPYAWDWTQDSLLDLRTGERTELDHIVRPLPGGYAQMTFGESWIFDTEGNQIHEVDPTIRIGICVPPGGNSVLMSDAVECQQEWIEARGEDSAARILRGYESLHSVQSTNEEGSSLVDGVSVPVTLADHVISIFGDDSHVLIHPEWSRTTIQLWSLEDQDSVWTLDTVGSSHMINPERFVVTDDRWLPGNQMTVQIYGPAGS